MGPTVLVTGGTGIVGRPLVRGLVAAGKRVIALSRQVLACEQGGEFSDVEYLRGDVSQPLLGLEPPVYQELCRTVQTIFHLAARTDFKGAGLADYQAINIDGVKNVHTLAQEAGGHLHHVSTAFVCGTHTGIFSEENLDCGQQFRNGYEESKFRGECYLRECLAAGAAGITIYRPGIILERQPSPSSAHTFGPFIFLDAVFRLLLTAKMQDEKGPALRISGQRSCHLPFIFDNDVAAALLQISQAPDNDGKTYHVVCQAPFGNAVLEDVFNQAFGRRVAALVAKEAFTAVAPSQPERIMARKTAKYAPYMDFAVHFERRNLEALLGAIFCRQVEEDELLQAFGLFLASKKEEMAGREIAAQERQDIEGYFEHFLPAIIGQQLIANLASLSCAFWLKVGALPCRTLVVEKGCLAAIQSEGQGDFGYKVRPEVFLQVVSGRLSPQRGFFDGDIALEGDTMAALRTATALEEFFQCRPYLVS